MIEALIKRVSVTYKCYEMNRKMSGFRLSLYIRENIVHLSHFLLQNHCMSNTKPTTNVNLRTLKNVVSCTPRHELGSNSQL
jgi:hypothetical protein